MSERLSQHTGIYDPIAEKDRFWPVYEEAFESGMRNWGIRVEVQGITVAELEADVKAQAIGDAIQQVGDPPGLLDHIGKVFSVFQNSIQFGVAAGQAQGWGDKKAGPDGVATNLNQLMKAFVPGRVSYMVPWRHSGRSPGLRWGRSRVSASVSTRRSSLTPNR